MKSYALYEGQPVFAVVLGWLFSSLMMIVGALWFIILAMFLVERLGLIDVSFIDIKGNIDWAAAKIQIIAITVFSVAIIVAIESFLSPFIGRSLSVLGFAAFLLIGLPMGLNIEAIRGMMWQITDPVVFQNHLWTYLLISLVVFCCVQYFYAHQTSRGVYERLRHG